MKLLLLGGTEFVGRSVAEEAVARGWEVTVFHRGHHPPPAGVTARHGDRTTGEGLSSLAEGAWDVVVDTWSGDPAAVRDVAGLLRDRAGRYVYISSRSVYRFPPPAGQDESGPLVDPPSATGDLDYATCKRGGEIAATEAFGDRALLARAGLILGPGENVGRLPWWLTRMARGGVVAAPGPRDLPLQYIDTRDLARWVLDAAAGGLGGAYDTVSPPGHTTMGELLETCARVTGSAAELRWLEPERILAAGVEPWTELPIWLPPGEMHGGLHGGNVAKALAAGLRCRPVAETVADTWAWLGGLGGTAPQRPDLPPVGLSPEKEAGLLARS
ncbi:reductase [Streptomyces pactum]|uniref:Reductase n=1 Tax=Streptomyces pactum TaxID=68249 RepID=A0ABS0NES5_9ACTN|nr:NAD-dependent epimerase/dehydratase family protein [Streptomyces pactum]MBH5333689.1 reductase [Streptomyces pactum]